MLPALMVALSLAEALLGHSHAIEEECLDGWIGVETSSLAQQPDSFYLNTLMMLSIHAIPHSYLPPPVPLAGHYFKPHNDGAYARDDGSGERSYLTLQLYLNGGEQLVGGDTTFLATDWPDGGRLIEDVGVHPEPGRVLIFEHKLFHESSEVTRGRKYVIRTDVMYRPS